MGSVGENKLMEPKFTDGAIVALTELAVLTRIRADLRLCKLRLERSIIVGGGARDTLIHLDSALSSLDQRISVV